MASLFREVGVIIIIDIPNSELERHRGTRLSECISEIARAHRRGSHLFVMKRSVSQWLTNNVSLSDADAAALKALGNSYTQFGTLVERNVKKIFIDRCQGELSVLGTGDVSVPLLNDWLEDIIDTPIMVLENIDSDVDFYETVLTYFSRNIIDLPYSCRFENGGGETLIRVCDRRVREHRVVVAIYDSDRLSPISPHTKRDRFARLYDRLDWPLFFPYSPNCRELENLLTIPALSKVPGLSTHPFFQLLHSSLYLNKPNTMEPLDQTLWLWADFKKGISTIDLVKIKNQAESAWISAILYKAGLNVFDFEINGFGPNIVRRILDDSGLKNYLYDSFAEDVWLREFQHYFDSIMAILCSRPKFIT